MFLRLLTCLCLAPGLAAASAWTRPAGDGFAAQTIAFVTSDEDFDRDGDARPSGGFDSWEARSYVEYGLRDGLTAVGQLTLIHKRVGGPPSDTRVGVDYVEGGLRQRLGVWGATVAAVQASARAPGAWGDDSPAAVGSADPEIDARIMLGRGWGDSGRDAGWISNGWIDLQAGLRARFGPPDDEARLDLTLGLKPRPRLSLIAQSFTTLSLGAPADTAKLQLSAVYAVTPVWSVQAGAGLTAWGRDAAKEATAFLAVWRPF